MFQKLPAKTLMIPTARQKVTAGVRMVMMEALHTTKMKKSSLAVVLQPFAGWSIPTTSRGGTAVVLKVTQAVWNGWVQPQVGLVSFCRVAPFHMRRVALQRVVGVKMVTSRQSQLNGIGHSKFGRGIVNHTHATSKIQIHSQGLRASVRMVSKDRLHGLDPRPTALARLFSIATLLCHKNLVVHVLVPRGVARQSVTKMEPSTH